MSTLPGRKEQTRGRRPGLFMADAFHDILHSYSRVEEGSVHHAAGSARGGRSANTKNMTPVSGGQLNMYPKEVWIGLDHEAKPCVAS